MEKANVLLKLEEIQDELKKSRNEMEKICLYEKRKELLQSIPEFWSTAFLGCLLVTELVTRKDEPIFNYLNSLDVEDSKVDYGYSITFYFNTNPYFEDEKLTKTFTILEDGTTKLSTMPIKWKDHSIAEDEDSFFNFITHARYKDIIEDDMVSDEEVGNIIKEDLWTNPLPYFKEGMEHESDEDESDEDESDEDRMVG